MNWLFLYAIGYYALYTSTLNQSQYDHYDRDYQKNVDNAAQAKTAET